MRKIEFDFILCFVLALAFTWSGYRLFFVTYSPFENNSTPKKQLGVVQLKKNIVKLKSSEVIFWQDAKDATPLYANDSIYTYEDSDAKLIFNGGVSLSLGSKTLFKVTPQGKAQSFEIKKGIAVFDIDKDSKSFSLNIGGKNIEVKGKAASFQINRDDKKAKVSLLKGEAQINIDGESLQIKKNQRLALEKGKSLQIEEVPIELISPAPKEKIYFESRPLVTFKWNELKKFQKKSLVISKDHYFKTIYKSIELSDKKSIDLVLESGNFFWKIIVQNNKDKEFESNSHNLILEKDIPPIIFSPNAGEILKASREISQKNPLPAIFKWENQQAEKYQYQIKKNDQIVKEGFSTEPKLKQSFEEAGSFSISIKSIDSKRNFSKFSKPVNFIIKQFPKIEAPFLRDIPVGGRYLTPKLENIELDLFLTNNPEVKTYELILSHDQDFKNIFYRNESNNPLFRVVVPKLGRIFAKSKGKDFLNRDLGNPKMTTLNLLLDAIIINNPTNQKENILEKPNQEITFNWSPIESIKQKKGSYLIEISQSEDFSKSIKFKTSPNFYNWKSEGPGTFYWRVIPDIDPENIAPPSVNVFHLKKPAPPAKIELPSSIDTEIIRRPKKLPKSSQNTLFFFNIAYAQEMEDIIPLSWPASPKASKYKIEIYQDQEMKKLLKKDEASSSNYEWKHIKPGSYYMRIAIVDFWGQVGAFSKLSLIRVQVPDYLKRKLDSPNLKAPYHKIEISRNRQKPLQFSWTKVEGAESYHFKIAKTLDFKDILFEKTLKAEQNSLSFSLSKLDYNKSIYWRVNAVGPIGQISKSKRRQIKYRKVLLEKEEDKIKEEKSKKEDQQEEKQKSFTKYWWLTYTTSPGMIDYQLTESNSSLNVNADGNILNGSNEIQGGFHFKPYWDMAFEAMRTNATFFDDKEFSMHAFAFQGGWYINHLFKVRLGPRLIIVDFFEKDSLTTITPMSKNLTSLKLNFIGTYQLTSKWNLQHDLSLGFGDAENMTFNALFNYQWKLKWHLGIGARYRQLKGVADNANLTINEKQLLLSIGTKL